MRTRYNLGLFFWCLAMVMIFGVIFVMMLITSAKQINNTIQNNNDRANQIMNQIRGVR